MVMIEVIFHVFIVIQFSVDVAFPYFHDLVALTSQVLDLFHGRAMEFLHGFAIVQVHGIMSVTFWASVPETAMDFVRRMGFLVIAVKQIGSNTFLATVAYESHLWANKDCFVLGAISQQWNDSDRIFWEVVSTIHEMAGRCNGECCKRIDVCDVMKQFAKF